MREPLNINNEAVTLGEVSSTTKSREQAEFERQQSAAEREHRRQLEAADKALQRRQEWLNFLVSEIGAKLFATLLLCIVVYQAWSILQNPNRSAEEDKFATSVIIAIATAFISFLTGRTVIVK